jgi:hypothetical protein
MLGTGFVAVEHPMIVTSRLMAGMVIEGAGTVHVEVVGRSDEGRVVYGYVIEGVNGRELYASQDVESGVGADPDFCSAARTILGFLSADGDAYRGAMARGGVPVEPYAFGEEMAEWAYMFESEIGYALCLLEGESA